MSSQSSNPAFKSKEHYEESRIKARANLESHIKKHPNNITIALKQFDELCEGPAEFPNASCHNIIWMASFCNCMDTLKFMVDAFPCKLETLHVSKAIEGESFEALKFLYEHGAPLTRENAHTAAFVDNAIALQFLYDHELAIDFKDLMATCACYASLNCVKFIEYLGLFNLWDDKVHLPLLANNSHYFLVHRNHRETDRYDAFIAFLTARFNTNYGVKVDMIGYDNSINFIHRD